MLHARLDQVDRILKGSRWISSSVRDVVQKNKHISRVFRKDSWSFVSPMGIPRAVKAISMESPARLSMGVKGRRLLTSDSQEFLRLMKSERGNEDE